MNSEEQIRAAVEKLDVVTAPRLVAALERLIDVWPEAQKLFEPRIDLLIADIKEHQKRERTKWLQA